MRFMKLSKTEISSIAIGKFDSLHLGHQKLFHKLSKNGGILIIDVEKKFRVLPKKYLSNFTNFPIFQYKLSEIRNLNGKEFIQKLKTDFPNLTEIIIGYDFQFGKERKCRISDLKEFSDFKITVVDEVKIENISVHSGEITKKLQNGEIELANKLLGREFSIIGKHIRGQGIGKKNLFPTLNIEYSDFITPKFGVYFTKTILENKKYDAISFLGIRETTDNRFSLETYIFDKGIEDKDFGSIEIIFKKFIRKNRSFENLADLKTQISKDIQIAKSYL